MGPYALSLIIVSLMDQPVQMVEVFTFPIKRSVQLSQTSVPRRYLNCHQEFFKKTGFHTSVMHAIRSSF